MPIRPRPWLTSGTCNLSIVSYNNRNWGSQIPFIVLKYLNSLQIESAWAHLVKYNKSMDRDVRFAVICGNSGGQKGIHIRGHDATKPTEIPVKVSILN